MEFTTKFVSSFKAIYQAVQDTVSKALLNTNGQDLNINIVSSAILAVAVQLGRQANELIKSGKFDLTPEEIESISLDSNQLVKYAAILFLDQFELKPEIKLALETIAGSTNYSKAPDLDLKTLN